MVTGLKQVVSKGLSNIHDTNRFPDDVFQPLIFGLRPCFENACDCSNAEAPKLLEENAWSLASSEVF